MKHRAFLALAAALIWVAPGRAAFADPPPARFADMGASRLNLSAAQQKKLSALESASRTRSQELFDQLRQTREKLSELYRKYQLDAVAAVRLNQDLNHTQGKLLDQRLSDQQQLRQILTSDQFAQLQSTIHRGPRHDRDDADPHNRLPRRSRDNAYPYNGAPTRDDNNTYRDDGPKPR